MKLKKNSMYLINLVQPSTPMVNVRQTASERNSEGRQRRKARYRSVLRTERRLDWERWLELGDNTQLLPPTDPWAPPS